MVCLALKPYQNTRGNIRAHFVSNVDPSHLVDTLEPGTRPPPCSSSPPRPSPPRKPCSTPTPRGPGLMAARGKGRSTRSPSTSSPSPPTKGRAVRHRHRQHVRFWDWVGGRYSLWSRHRPAHRPVHRHGPLRGTAGRRPRHGRAFPHRAAWTRTCRCSWPCWASGTTTSGTPTATPCCPTSSTCPLHGLSPAVRHGEQRQVVTRDGKPVKVSTGPVCSASRAPTASTPSTSSSTRAPS
jgi:hypothetical protein